MYIELKNINHWRRVVRDMTPWRGSGFPWTWKSMYTTLWTPAQLCMKWDVVEKNCHHQRSSASGPLDAVVMNILQPLRKTTKANEYVIFITDMYSRLARTIYTARIATKSVEAYYCTSLLSHMEYQRISQRSITDSTQVSSVPHMVHISVQRTYPQPLIAIRQTDRQNGTTKQLWRDFVYM